MYTIAAGPDLIQLLKLAYAANQPVLLHGNHGVGKTQILESAAQNLGIGLLVRDLSLMEPVDLVGIPQVLGDGRTHYASPSFLPDSGRGLIVFEELNRCPRYMQAPCLQLLTARVLNDYHLPTGWLPCAAINDLNEGYLVEELDQALLSRFLRVRVVPGVDEWLAWAESARLHPKVVEFVENSPKVFDDPVANPRAWAYASRLLIEWQAVNHSKNQNPNEDLLLIALAGVVGEKWALAFHQHLNGLKRPLRAVEILESYSAHQSSVRGWLSTGHLDLINSSLENLKRHLKRQYNYNAMIENAKSRDNVELFVSHLPGDLRADFFAWADERDFPNISARKA